MTFANKITLFRILSIPFFIACLAFYTPEKNVLKFAALAIFLLAIVSDVVDGYIARARREKTRAGAILDPLADKAMLIAAFIFLYRISKAYFTVSLPLWVVLITLSRDAIILIGSGIIMTARTDFKVSPTWWGKLTTFFQMMTVIAVMTEFRFSPVIWWTAAGFTVISCIDYARKGINILNNLDHDAGCVKTTPRPPC